MKTKEIKLPAELKAFIDQGNTTFHCEDGDWDLRIAFRENSPFKDELPLRSIQIAENGCGDCLFLKTSAGGKLDPKVFVFWHEEDRFEVVTKHVKQLTAAIALSTSESKSSVPSPPMSISQLEAALASPDLSAREDAIRQFEKTEFRIDALPALRRALADDWVGVVLSAARCIGKLGPEAVSSPAGQCRATCEQVNLVKQLWLAGSKVWSYSLYTNCYSTCLKTLERLEVEDDIIIGYVQSHIGLCGEDDLIDSLNVLKRVGTAEAINILKRAAKFWLPELNMKYANEVKKIFKSAKVIKK
jgi:hypothetical protein